MHLINNIIVLIYIIFIIVSGTTFGKSDGTNSDVFPDILQGDWFTWEDGKGHQFVIDQSEYRSRGEPLEWNVVSPDIRDYVFVKGSCSYCSRFVIRSWNIVERFDGEYCTQSLKTGI